MSWGRRPWAAARERISAVSCAAVAGLEDRMKTASAFRAAKMRPASEVRPFPGLSVIPQVLALFLF